MGQFSPTAADTYYSLQVPGTGFFQFATVTNQGNLNLKSETADTLTAGFVFRPAFEAAALSRLTASIDWYSIEIEDAISALSFDTIYGQCVRSGDLTNPFCQRITRDPGTGNPARTLGIFLNVGVLETSGVDLNIDWSADLADIGLGSLPGALSANLAFTYLDKFEAQAVQGEPVLDYSGTVGGISPATAQNGQFRTKTFMTLGYSVGGVSTSLRWRHLPSARAAAFAVDPTTLFRGPSSYSVFDLTGNWEISQTYQVRFGIENLLDEEPEITNINTAPAPAGSSGQGTTLPGYYDVLGRRYFVGFKARF
jgi:outer membrane receptor protein involved in Fe transport